MRITSHEEPQVMVQNPLTPQIEKTADLLRSLQDSIQRLRNVAEALREQLEADQEVGGDISKPQIAKLEGLIRDCQKVEKTLVAQSSQFASLAETGPSLDLDQLRGDLRCRLATLRACCDERDVSGGTDG
ncbi:recombinase [Parasedimentitalea denitrificans]|nr:recombinase [Sedimentitalea sp. CY04]